MQSRRCHRKETFGERAGHKFTNDSRGHKEVDQATTEGLKRVKSDRSVYVDPTDKKFRKSTGDLAPGYADLV